MDLFLRLLAPKIEASSLKGQVNRLNQRRVSIGGLIRQKYDMQRDEE